MSHTPPALPLHQSVVDDNAAQQRAIATVTVLAVTALFTTWQFWNPNLLPLFDRNFGALLAGQWWRLITPRLVQPAIWPQYFLLAILALVGPPVERRVGPWRWLLFWLVGGLVGEVVSFAWVPHGAGASVGICGIMGAWLLLALRRDELVPWWVAIVVLAFLADLMGMALGSPTGAAVAAAIIAGALVQLHQRTANWPLLLPWIGSVGLLSGLILTLLRDQHGPPLLAGAAVAMLLIPGKRL